ncbi:GNAT family N-acyltransferase [Nocardia sp. NPDC058658]|uniref:GNAT family N-acyltransferase n=1 Tax=Nocardia sp. NPDC058658 TaxID=3346580 RepID=UPI0036471128
MRTGVYLDSGRIRPDQLDPDGLFRDKYDDYSIHVLATEDGTAVGSIRMIQGRLGQLQACELFDLPAPEGDTFEVSACAVVRDYRKSMVTLGLYRALFDLGEQWGYRHAYMVLAEPFRQAIVALGFPAIAVSEPRRVYNSWDVVAAVKLSSVSPGLAGADRRRGDRTRFADFFTEPFAWSLDPATLSTVADA